MFARTVFLGLGPLIALMVILFLDLDPARPEVTRMAAVTLWMAIWWVSEAVPIPVTALLPIILFPLLGILSGAQTAPHYFDSILFLFMGGFIIAIAMERWDLHRRIALGIIRAIGSGRARLLLGFMAASAFLSMWISNTATTMMMIPIAMAVLLKLEECATENAGESRAALGRFGIGLFLSVAYAANIGGMSTLIGTPPNLAFRSIFARQFPHAPEISFLEWMLFGIPLALVLLTLTWGLLYTLYVRRRKSEATAGTCDETAGQVFFDEQYMALGKMSGEERQVLVIFCLTALLWITRSSADLGGITVPGWGQWLPMADDGTVAMVMAVLLFILPSRRSGHGHLLNWEDLHRFPWGILILFGGGFALAEGFQTSGLSGWLGSQLMALGSLDPFWVVGGSCSVMLVLTEFASNTPSTQMMLPILAALATSAGLHPLLLMIPATITASLGFMLPVGTPPNAIVFATQRVPIREMAKAGLIIDLAGVAVITGMIFLLGHFAFGILPQSPPDWSIVPPGGP